jgi:F-type H+-transporting ATPase subunit a
LERSALLPEVQQLVRTVDSRFAIAGHGSGVLRDCPNGRSLVAFHLGRIPVRPDIYPTCETPISGGDGMSRSPLETVVVFHIGPIAITGTVVTTWILIAAVVIACLLATCQLDVIPGNLQAITETLISEIEEQIRGIVNREPAEFLPLLGTLFIFLATANLSGLVPGVRAPTASIETEAALAAIVFFSVHVFGVKRNGLRRYLKNYLKPNPLLLPLNILSEFTRSFSLMMRLFGNIMSDELVIAIVVSLAGLLVPIPFMVFEILVGLIQAYIFTVLAAVYIGGAIGSIEK